MSKQPDFSIDFPFKYWKIKDLYSHRALTHTSMPDKQRPDLVKKYPEGKNPSTERYWNFIKDMTAKECYDLLTARRTELSREDRRNYSMLWRERTISHVVVKRLFDAGLWDRRSDCGDRRECKSGDRRKDLK
jgi:hypothetical protein